MTKFFFWRDLPEDIEWWLEVETTESGLLKLTKSLGKYL